jgi:hypothetical protein
MKKYLIGFMVLGMSQMASAGFVCTSVDKTMELITLENGDQSSVYIKDGNNHYFLEGSVAKTDEYPYKTFSYTVSKYAFKADLKIVSQEIRRGCTGRACLKAMDYTVTKGKLNFLGNETDFDCQ